MAAGQTASSFPLGIVGASPQGKECIEAADPSNEDCVICLQALDSGCVKTPCGHHFHDRCLDQYLLTQRQQQVCSRMMKTAKCPLCRQSLRQPFLVEASSTSGLCIMVTAVPPVGAECHFDRVYSFKSLGDFQRPGMLYVMTSNDDRKTSSNQVMWVLEARVPIIVHLNFRSEGHVTRTGASTWLSSRGWTKNSSMKSTVSTGVPNGPYSGPVYSRRCAPGRIELMGSNTWEGVYFVFVELVDANLLRTVQGTPPTPIRGTAGPPSLSLQSHVAQQAASQPQSPLSVRLPLDIPSHSSSSAEVLEEELRDPSETEPPPRCSAAAKQLVSTSRRRIEKMATRFRSARLRPETAAPPTSGQPTPSPSTGSNLVPMERP
mmetsp:Transcript_22130/g.50650  ORF Transcript_22130/g.50650 Transcript_22130/m.50650 type:complete len:376 (-) Transcript_22130:162-1289(-)